MTIVAGMTLFWSSYAQVFLLGFQSKNVQRSKYLLAFVTSLGICVSQFVFVRLGATAAPEWFLPVSGVGGALGIVSAIKVHDLTHQRSEKRADARKRSERVTTPNNSATRPSERDMREKTHA